MRRKPTTQEAKKRKQFIEEYKRAYGNLCPGWKRPPHNSTDLTVDHIIPLSKGGAEDGRIRVLCRSCNSRRRAKKDPIILKKTKTYRNPLKDVY